MENALQNAMESVNQIVQDYQQQSLETKRMEDVPTRKVQSIPSPTHSKSFALVNSNDKVGSRRKVYILTVPQAEHEHVAMKNVD